MFKPKDEPKWCEKAKGKAVLVRDLDKDVWAVDQFSHFDGRNFVCEMHKWKQARPMTRKEADELFYFEEGESCRQQQ